MIHRNQTLARCLRGALDLLCYDIGIRMNEIFLNGGTYGIE